MLVWPTEMTRPVSVDHLQRCSQIFRSDRTKMVCSIWKISEIFGWTERAPGLNTSFAPSLGILTTNVASNCGFANLRKGYLSNLNYFPVLRLRNSTPKMSHLQLYACIPTSSAKHWYQLNFKEKQSGFEGGHSFVGREKLFYRGGFSLFPWWWIIR